MDPKDIFCLRIASILTQLRGRLDWLDRLSSYHAFTSEGTFFMRYKVLDSKSPDPSRPPGPMEGKSTRMELTKPFCHPGPRAADPGTRAMNPRRGCGTVDGLPGAAAVSRRIAKLETAMRVLFWSFGL